MEAWILLDDTGRSDDRRKYQCALRSGKACVEYGALRDEFDLFKELKTNNRLRPKLEKTFESARNSNGILLKRGDNFGDFNFGQCQTSGSLPSSLFSHVQGSTVVLVFEAPDNLVFNFKSGDPIKLGEALCAFDTHKDTRSHDNESTILSTDDNESIADDDDNETPHPDQDSFHMEEHLLVDTVGLEAAIVDADAVADQEVISTNDKESFSSDARI